MGRNLEEDFCMIFFSYFIIIFHINQFNSYLIIMFRKAILDSESSAECIGFNMWVIFSPQWNLIYAQMLTFIPGFW